jgi:signal transduction histidine kinase
MIKTFLFTILFSLTVSTGVAQNKYTDSLKYQLALAKDDTSKALVMAELCYFFRYSSTDSSLYYGEKALALSQKMKFWKGEANALNRLGLTIREKGDFPKSLELQFKSLKIAKEHSYLLGIANANRRMGLVYSDLGDNTKALQYANEALKYDILACNNRGIALQYMNIGIAYGQLNMYDSATYYLNKAFDNQAVIKDILTELNNYMGNVEAKKKNFREALALYNKGISIGIPNNDYRSVSNIFSNIADIQRQLHQTDSGILSAEKALQYGLLATNKKSIYTANKLLAELYDSINPQLALRYYKTAAATKDSLIGAGNLQTIQAMVAKEEARQKEIEQAEVAYQNKLKQYALIAGLTVFSVIAIILYSNNRQKQKANKVLESTLVNLKSTQAQLIQSEKMASLGELTAGIAHEIQNPLNFVNNFSELSNELIDEMKEEFFKGEKEQGFAIADDIKQNLEKINHHGKRADAIVKGMLQHSQSGSGVKQPTDINALAGEYIRLAYNGYRAKDKLFSVTMDLEFDPDLGKIQVEPQDIGRVLLNLYNNAFYVVDKKTKAGIAGYMPKITVRTRSLGKTVSIEVQDNGEGIPENIRKKIFQPFFTTKPAGQGTGLGLSLSYDIITKGHGGEMQVESQEGEGSTFRVILPLESE